MNDLKKVGNDILTYVEKGALGKKGWESLIDGQRDYSNMKINKIIIYRGIWDTLLIKYIFLLPICF